MELRTIPIAELKAAEYNPRQISKENFERLRRSIREFGMTVPCTVNMHPGRENVLIAGHMRTRAAEAEGLKEVPCWVVNVDPTKEKMLNIALNNENLAGRWDYQMLADMVIKLNEDDSDVTLTGFDETQLIAIQEGTGPRGLPNGGDELMCERCIELRKGIEGHEKRSGHKTYDGHHAE
jgi:hypothetical protein